MPRCCAAPRLRTGRTRCSSRCWLPPPRRRADRESVGHLLRARGLVDLVIPRGGAGLISYVVENSTVPVIETGVGNVHIYVDADADLDMAERIVVNAKVSRPSVCNAAETLLVHRAVADEFVPRIVNALQDKGVTLHGRRVCCP